MTNKYKLLIHNAAQVVQITADTYTTVLKGADQSKPIILGESNERYSVLVDGDGHITNIGTDAAVAQVTEGAMIGQVLDAKGAMLMPGFVDGHTHAVFAGDRVNEFAMKLADMQIHAAGGGIHSTVRAVRNASVDQLSNDLLVRIGNMAKTGTTTIEVKSGYGLDADTELKMLQAIDRAQANTQIELSPTFCGAHAIPEGYNAEKATENVCFVQMPKICESGVRVENVDVFCETGVFDVDQTRRICLEAKKIWPNSKINIHGDELSCIGGAELGGELKAAAVSHLEEASDTGIEAMAQSGTVATLLPTTAYMLRLKSPPARKMIDAGVPVALGSDFNPNAYCFDMPMVMHLACCLFRLTMEEALVAATINSAHSLGRGHTHGALSIGRKADILVINSLDWRNIIYKFGNSQNLISKVFKNGDLVVDNP